MEIAGGENNCHLQELWELSEHRGSVLTAPATTKRCSGNASFDPSSVSSAAEKQEDKRGSAAKGSRRTALLHTDEVFARCPHRAEHGCDRNAAFVSERPCYRRQGNSCCAVETQQKAQTRNWLCRGRTRECDGAGALDVVVEHPVPEQSNAVFTAVRRRSFATFTASPLGGSTAFPAHLCRYFSSSGLAWEVWKSSNCTSTADPKRWSTLSTAPYMTSL